MPSHQVAHSSPASGILQYWLGRTWMALFGWEVVGEVPPGGKFVLVGAPHTSNWDFPFTLAAVYSLRLRISWMGKDSIFKGPLGAIMRRLGGIAINREQLTYPVSSGYEWAKQVGTAFKDRVETGDRIADRKPFFAYYAGGEYVEIPMAPYDDCIAHLAADDVKYLVLHRRTISTLRPLLMPLLVDRAVMNGEMRYTRIFNEDDVSIFRWSTACCMRPKQGRTGRSIFFDHRTSVWGLWRKRRGPSIRGPRIRRLCATIT